LQRNEEELCGELPVTRASADPLSDQEQAYLILLFNKYRGPLYRYLSGLVRCTDDVAELVQETYFETVARAYLFQTATNVAREYYRRRARRHADRHVGLEEAAILSDESIPEQDALWKEALGRLRTELKTLPEELREVLVRHRFGQQTYSQIAATLGVSTRTVERRMSQAIELLAARLRGVL
jgi:RNA polymerase sigma factor (sigma-70 family)